MPFTFVILFVIGAFLIAAYLFEGREYERVVTQHATSVERLFRQSLENDATMMQAALTVIARDESIKRAYLSRDREALLKQIWPLFNNLRDNNRISHFYFTDPQRVNFLRVHKPDEYGDTIDRITTLRAAGERVPARGIELGPLGTFTLRVVLPWYDGKSLIGYLELGEEIDHITDEVHRILGADLLVLVYEKFLGLKQWESGKKLLGHKEDWPHFGNTFVVGRAMKHIPRTLIKILERGEHTYTGSVQTVEDSRSLYINFLPLKDISGREVGDFIVVEDVTDARAGFLGGMMLTAVMSVLVGSIVFILLYVILGKVERDYRHQREVELQLSRLDTEHQKVIQVEKLSAMGLMIGEIAHQLNNPLVGVVNMAQLAEREVEDPVRTRELLGDVVKAGRDCHQFVKRMLQFTKLSNFDRRPSNLNTLIKETVDLFQQSNGHLHNVVKELSPDAPWLNVDPVLIRHALFNLLSNAAQVSPPGATITVSLYPETPTAAKLSGWCIAVSDEGCGLTDEVQEKMFTPFFTTYAEGTGLGLPVVQNVVILHQGHIRATNNEAGGALFELCLPVTEMDA